MRLVMAGCRTGEKTHLLLNILEADKGLPRPTGHALGLDWDEGYGIGPDGMSTERWDEVLPEKGLVRVLVTIFGRQAPIELEYWQIQKQE